MTYPPETRERARLLIEGGMNRHRIATELGLPPSTIRTWFPSRGPRPSHCLGCGTAIAQPDYGARKWCSDRCRKTQYAGACIDCDATLNGSDGRGPNASKRCPSCQLVIARAVNSERRQCTDQRVADLYRSGLSLRSIAAEIGSTVNSVATRMVRMRSEGWELPYRRTPRKVAA